MTEKYEVLKTIKDPDKLPFDKLAAEFDSALERYGIDVIIFKHQDGIEAEIRRRITRKPKEGEPSEQNKKLETS